MDFIISSEEKIPDGLYEIKTSIRGPVSGVHEECMDTQLCQECVKLGQSQHIDICKDGCVWFQPDRVTKATLVKTSMLHEKIRALEETNRQLEGVAQELSKQLDEARAACTCNKGSIFKSN